MYITLKWGRKRGGWAREAYLGFYVEECPMFQKYW
jgi:hypothetical protein